MSQLQKAVEAQAAEDRARYRKIILEANGKISLEQARELASIAGRLDIPHEHVESDITAHANYLTATANAKTGPNIKVLERAEEAADAALKRLRDDYHEQDKKLSHEHFNAHQAMTMARQVRNVAVAKVGQLQREFPRLFSDSAEAFKSPAADPAS